MIRIDAVLVRDSVTGGIRDDLAGAKVTIVTRGTTTPFPIYAETGDLIPGSQVTVTPIFSVPSVYLADEVSIPDTYLDWLAEDGTVGPVNFEVQLRNDAMASAQAAEAAAELAAAAGGGGAGVASDEGVAGLVADPASATAQALADVYGAGILILDLDAEVPEGTAPGTVIIRTGAGTPTLTVYAKDDFDRTTTAEGGGWGAAEAGGSWYNLFSSSIIETPGNARIFSPTTSTGRATLLDGVSVVDSDIYVQFSVGVGGTSGAQYALIQSRYNTSGDGYRFGVRIYPSNSASSAGSVDLTIGKSGSFSNVQAALVGRLTGYTAGRKINARCQTEGSSLRMRVWYDGDPEPTFWHVNTTDAEYDQPGSVSLGAYLTGSTNFTPQEAFFHDFLVTEIPA